jgi:capsular polysaccharide transport system permease protein
MQAPSALSNSSASVTWSVWKALFLREAVTRLSTRRFAWVWLLLEPVTHVVYLMFLFAVIRARMVGGIDTPLWIMIGLLAFFMFKNTGVQARNAIDGNRALYVYRQVKPVDCVLIRCALEGFLLVMITFILLGGAGLFGFVGFPADPLAVLEAFFGLWLVGIGFGLITSVITELLPELGKIIDMTMAPLYLMSGVIFPLGKVPSPYRGWLMYNPVAHGIEGSRLGFTPYYQAVPEMNMTYVYQFAIVAIFLGLLLHVRYSSRLMAQ